MHPRQQKEKSRKKRNEEKSPPIVRQKRRKKFVYVCMSRVVPIYTSLFRLSSDIKKSGHADRINPNDSSYILSKCTRRRG